MPKNTQKYVAACAKAQELGLLIPAHQEALYHALSEYHWYWDSDKKSWYCLAKTAADPPSELIRIRVWSDSRFVEQVAKDLVKSMAAQGFRLVEKSEPFICRPPKQLESRVYLTFQKDPEGEVPQSSDAVLGVGLNV